MNNEMNFKSFFNEASRHAVDQVTSRIMKSAQASPQVFPNPQATIRQVLKNVEIAEIIYRGPKTYAIEILPRFPVLVSERGSFPIPKTRQEAMALPDFRNGTYGSVGNTLVAILEPPVKGLHDRDENKLNTSTIKFSRSPDLPNANRPDADKFVPYEKFVQDSQSKQGMIGKAQRLGLVQYQ